MNECLSRFAALAAWWTGHWAAFTPSAGLVLVWGVSGPFFGWSGAWRLSANTGAAIVKAIDSADDRMRRAEDESEEALRNEIATLRGDG